MAGILAAVALPAYQDYTARAQAAEGLTLTSGLRVDIAERISLGENIDAIAAEDSTLEGKYVESVSVTGTGGTGDEATAAGDITVTFKSSNIAAAIAGESMVLTLTDGNRWVCSGDDGFHDKYLPSGCKAAAGEGEETP